MMPENESQSTAIDFRDVYIAGPLFTSAERAYLEQIDELCRELGLTTYLPHRDGGFSTPEWNGAHKIFTRDIQMLEHSQYVIAVLNGPDIDSGTSWELGFAYARKKELLGIREDRRGKIVNLMISASLRIVDSVNELRKALLCWVPT